MFYLLNYGPIKSPEKYVPIWWISGFSEHSEQWHLEGPYVIRSELSGEFPPGNISDSHVLYNVHR